MIDPIRVHFDSQNQAVIDNGPFLGHVCSHIASYDGYWKVSGRTFNTFQAALYAVMADAYAYVAQQLSSENEL